MVPNPKELPAMSAQSLVVLPPKQSRTRSSSADRAILDAMASEIKPGVFVTNGEQYNEYQPASNASQTYRRALAGLLGVDDYKVKSRVWGTDSKSGNVLQDRAAKGAWQFALTVNPDAVKQERQPRGGGNAAS